MTSAQEFIPTALILAYLAGGALLYALVGSRGVEDEEAAHRQTGATNRWMRVCFAWLMAPGLRLLSRAEIPANAVTRVSLAFSLAAGVALAAGHFSLGGFIFLLASVCDYFDGRLARAQGGGTRRGAALDSIVDRYSEVALLTGLCWYYRQTWVIVPALFALSGSLLVPYARAKAESLGITISDVGFLQRPERAAILGVTTALSPLVDWIAQAALSVEARFHWLTVFGICLIAVGTQLSAAQRTFRLLELLAEGAKKTPRRGLRAVATSAIATASDAALVAYLSWTFAQALPLATALGCLLGALVNFSLNRHWAFDATDGKLGRQSRRYVVVSISSAAFNAAGVAIMTLLPEVPAAVSWLLVRGLIFATWTFPLYDEYVFPSGPSHTLTRGPAHPETAPTR